MWGEFIWGLGGVVVLWLWFWGCFQTDTRAWIIKEVEITTLSCVVVSIDCSQYDIYVIRGPLKFYWLVVHYNIIYMECVKFNFGMVRSWLDGYSTC